MSSSLLVTKLRVPQLRSEHVLRPQLVTHLQQGLTNKLILISAPAGYGKTTLASEWLATCDQACAWVSLDDGDNDPPRFWAYLLAALQSALAAVGRQLPDDLRQPHPQVSEALITDLINGLDELQQPLILVLDDYHLIETQFIHDELSFLLDHAPAHFQLVIVTRADPPLPLARLRARSQLLEIRQADLSFTTAEAATFLNHTMGLRISAEDIARITARTEGWIAGLQMAALSMQNAEDVSNFVEAFTGSHHYIFDYLLEEVLERQSPELRRFLLYTSILDQLTAPLCDALLNEDVDVSTTHSSDAILEQLDHANLFIIPLDNERRRYRYHALFAELLRNYLGQKHAEQLPALHTRASTWFEEQGSIAEAIHHALLAGNWEQVVALISANIFALLEQNELNAVAKLLERIAADKSLARPWLWIGRAWLAAYTGQVRDVEAMLEKAEAEIGHALSGPVQQSLRGHCAAIRAFTAWVEGRRDIARQAAREALTGLPATDLTIRCQSATVLGLSLNDMEERSQAYAEALEYARGCRVSHVVLFAYGCHAYALVLQGRLRAAQAACEDAIQLARSSSTHQPLPTLCHVYSTLSGIFWEWNDLKSSLQYAREAVALARRWEQADALHFAYTNLGNALFASGDTAEAFDVLQEAWQIARRTSSWFEEITLAQEIEWHLAQANLEVVFQRLQLNPASLDETPEIHYSLLPSLSFIQLFLARQQYALALKRIQPVLDDLEQHKVVYYQVRVLVWQAQAYHRLGQAVQALTAFKKALLLAAPEGYLRTFLMAGDDLAPMLHQARAAGIAAKYVDTLLSAVGQEGMTKPIKAGTASPWIEPLSTREVEVLRLLAQGCTDKKIAEALVIAPETVHKHLKNIYGKLEVHNRTEAVARARASGLL